MEVKIQFIFSFLLKLWINKLFLKFFRYWPKFYIILISTFGYTNCQCLVSND